MRVLSKSIYICFKTFLQMANIQAHRVWTLRKPDEPIFSASNLQLPELMFKTVVFVDCSTRPPVLG